jgi:hypothetical protein
MKKPGLSLAAILLLVSTNLSAAIVSATATESCLPATGHFSMFDSSMFSVNSGYLGSITYVAKNNTPAAGVQEESTIPVPAAAWLFVSGLLGMIGVSRRKRKQ